MIGSLIESAVQTNGSDRAIGQFSGVISPFSNASPGFVYRVDRLNPRDVLWYMASPESGEHLTATLALPQKPIRPTAKLAKPVAILSIKTQLIQCKKGEKS
jgi:hypothetical protein